jgi:hypothetical protein
VLAIGWRLENNLGCRWLDLPIDGHRSFGGLLRVFNRAPPHQGVPSAAGHDKTLLEWKLAYFAAIAMLDHSSICTRARSL